MVRGFYNLLILVTCVYVRACVGRAKEYNVTHIIGILTSDLLTPWSTVLLEKLTGFAANQEIPRIYGTTRKFIPVLTSARHLSVSCANSIQSPQPPPTSRRSILMLSSHLRLGLPNGLLPSGFPTKTLCTPLPSPYVPHAPPTSFFSISSPAQYWVRSTDH